MSSAPSDEQRERLWEHVFDTYYRCYYWEILAGLLLYRWQLFDQVSKTVIAITASTSAVAGWALWNQAGYSSLWASISALGALLAIVHASVGAATWLKTWREIQSTFVSLRVDLETFRMHMQQNVAFDFEEARTQFAAFRDRFAQALARIEIDTLNTPGLQSSAQAQVDDLLRDELEGA